MGSFNMACKVTNLPINYGDPVVAYAVTKIDGKHGRGEAGDCLVSTHYITSWPIHGKYNDYGQIETDEKIFGEKHPDEGEPDENEYMIMHEFAYKTIRDAVFRERVRHKAWTDKYYAENGTPDWIIEEREGIEAEIVLQEQRLADPDNFEDPGPRLMNRGMSVMFYAPEGEYPHERFWRAAFLKSDEPRMFYEAYKENISWMHSARYAFNFHIGMSLYAGQEVEDTGLLELHQKCVEHLQEYRREYGCEDDV